MARFEIRAKIIYIENNSIIYMCIAIYIDRIKKVTCHITLLKFSYDSSKQDAGLKETQFL